MDTNHLAGPYLTFRLDKESFAVSVKKVREVLEFTPITKVPRSPEHMLGVINLRGSVVPVMDLGIKFALCARIVKEDTGIVVMEVALGNDMVILGMVVDGVDEVVELTSQEIQPPPPMGSVLQTEFLLGLGQREERFLMLLDMDKVFSSTDVINLSEAG
jgi:purine-binding chemotaxis protein CheW